MHNCMIVSNNTYLKEFIKMSLLYLQRYSLYKNIDTHCTHKQKVDIELYLVAGDFVKVTKYLTINYLLFWLILQEQQIHR